MATRSWSVSSSTATDMYTREVREVIGASVVPVRNIRQRGRPRTAPGPWMNACSGRSGSRTVLVATGAGPVLALPELREAGLAVVVPEDVAIVSFDGAAEADYTNPQLTTVRQPIEAMARAAVDRVLGIDDTDGGHGGLMPPEFVLGASCGCSVRR
ncbi:substrate-binding domain-containing protein [Curtobacterium luteum]|nr:substrate-binding domain-containing protein [Curtobacterium luteum]